MRSRVPRARAFALLALAAAGVAAFGGWWAWRAARASRPDVLLIVVDTLRADHLGAYGYPYPTSPNLDALAEDGVRFSRYFSAASWTRPSMATVVTGLHPRQTGVHEEKFDILPKELVTLPERLAADGYLTLGATANPNINRFFGFGQGFVEYGDSGVVWPWMPARGGKEVYDGKEARADTADELTARALALVDRFEDRMRSEPWYLQLLYIDPHEPYDPPKRHRRPVKGSPTADYDGEIHYVDAAIGGLLDELRDRGLLDDTLIIATSDHGQGLKDHPGVPRAESHGTTLYDSALHVPLILSHPSLPNGRVVDELVSSVDLVPTVLDLAGVDAPAGDFAGRSVAPLARGTGPVEGLPDRVFSETDWRVQHKVSVRTDAYKLVRNDDSRLFQQEGAFEGATLDERDRQLLTEIPPVELYRVDGDAKENPHQTDLWARQPEVVADLEASLEAFERATAARPPQRRDPADVLTTPNGTTSTAGEGAEAPEPLDPGMAEQLEALGYLDAPE